MSRTSATPTLKRQKGGSLGIEEILRQRLVTGIWRPNDRLPTEKQLAEELNVCQATVQRHLRELQKEGLIWGRRGKGRFVSSIGQRPRTGNIGVVLFDSRHMANPAMSETVASVGNVAAEANRGLRIFIGNELAARKDTEKSPPGGSPDEAAFLGSPANMGVDGLIILTQRISPETVRQLAATVPVVCTHMLPFPNITYIVLDMAAGTFDATRYLLDLGHRRIALLTKETSDASGRASREGARLAMGSVSDGDPSQGLQTYTPVEFTEAEGYRLTKELLAQPRRATAIICSDHLMALGVLQAIDEAGLRIPEDMSVISWNNVLLERTPVTITSVCFDRKDAGARFCKRVIECIEHPDRNFEPEYLRPQLVIRQSTGAPPSDGSR